MENLTLRVGDPPQQPIEIILRSEDCHSPWVAWNIIFRWMFEEEADLEDFQILRDWHRNRRTCKAFYAIISELKWYFAYVLMSTVSDDTYWKDHSLSIKMISSCTIPTPEGETLTSFFYHSFVYRRCEKRIAVYFSIDLMYVKRLEATQIVFHYILRIPNILEFVIFYHQESGVLSVFDYESWYSRTNVDDRRHISEICNTKLLNAPLKGIARSGPHPRCIQALHKIVARDERLITGVVSVVCKIVYRQPSQKYDNTRKVTVLDATRESIFTELRESLAKKRKTEHVESAAE